MNIPNVEVEPLGCVSHTPSITTRTGCITLACEEPYPSWLDVCSSLLLREFVAYFLLTNVVHNLQHSSVVSLRS